jgi:hypothetical protein
MKLNPYPVLLTTGVLMFVTVLLAQTGTSGSLVKAGVVSLNRDVSSLAVRAWAAWQGHLLVADDPSGADVARHPDTRLAAVDTAPAESGGRAGEE